MSNDISTMYTKDKIRKPDVKVMVCGSTRKKNP